MVMRLVEGQELHQLGFYAAMRKMTGAQAFADGCTLTDYPDEVLFGYGAGALMWWECTLERERT